MNAKTQAQYQNIDGNDLAQFKDARTRTVVSPSNLASGTLVYPYAKAKRRILKDRLCPLTQRRETFAFARPAANGAL